MLQMCTLHQEIPDNKSGENKRGHLRKNFSKMVQRVGWLKIIAQMTCLQLPCK